MSFQRDYLLRMLEMMGDLVAALLGKVKKKEFSEANEQLEHIYTEFLRKDAAFFRTLPIDGMTKTLLEEHNYTNDHLLILAELFYAEAELQAAKNNTNEALLLYKKANSINNFIDATLKTFDEKRLNRVKLIEGSIEALENASNN